MAGESWRPNEIEVDVAGFFTTHHRLQTEVGTWGKFTFPAFSHQGSFRTADGRELVMRKTHWLGSAHEMLEEETVCAVADRQGLLRREILIQFDSRDYLLEPEGLLSQGWYLTDTEGNRLLAIRRRGLLRQGAYLTILGAVHADLIAFAYYLIHVRWQEDSAAAAASAAAAS